MIEPKPMSLWDASAKEADTFTKKPIDPKVDVAIVGGGYSGLSTALHCAEAGLTVQVIEAKQIGYGGSGRNVGLVNAGVWLPPRQVRKKLGQTYGPRFLKRFGAGPEMVFDLIEKHQIQCEATRNGTIHAAHNPSGVRNLRGRWEDWAELGEPVELLSRGEAAEMIGSDHFHGGLLDKRAGTINPMGYCRGLARAAIGAGAGVTTGTRVTKLIHKPDGWRVQTDTGELQARSVVICTNAYTDELWPGLNQSFTMIHYFQLSTAPLGDRINNILPGKQGLWDTATIMSSLRRDDDNRLIIGSMGQAWGNAHSGLSQRWAHKRLSRLFPSLGPVNFEDTWHGQIAMTPDHMPRIHMLAKGLYTPIGYNGRGITTGTIFGQGIAGLLTGADPADLPLPITKVASNVSAPLMKRFYNLAFSANQILRGL